MRCAGAAKYEMLSDLFHLNGIAYCKIVIVLSHLYRKTPHFFLFFSTGNDLGEDKPSCPGSLRAGDIYTHCFHGWPSTIINPLNGHNDVPAMLVNEGYFLTWVTDVGLSHGLWKRSVRRRAFGQILSVLIWTNNL